LPAPIINGEVDSLRKMVKFPTFKGSWPWSWPWIGWCCILSYITHRPLATYRISLRSKKIFFSRVTIVVTANFKVTWHKN